MPIPAVFEKSAASPVAVLKLPCVLLNSANTPLAVFGVPLLLLKSEPVPVSVFRSAVVASSVPAPTPVFKLPVLSLLSERYPSALLRPPVVRIKSADCILGSIATGVTAVWQRDYGGQISQKRKAKKHECSGNESNHCFYKHRFEKIPLTCRDQNPQAVGGRDRAQRQISSS